MGIQQLLLGTSKGGVDPVDFVKLGISGAGGGDTISVHYGEDGSIYHFNTTGSWKAVKMDAAGELVWSKKFSSHGAGTIRGMAIGQNDIQVYVGHHANNVNLWALSKDGALLWTKRWNIDHSSDTNAGSTFYNHSGSGWVRSVRNADIGVLLLEPYNVDSSGGSYEHRAPIMLSFKMSDGTKIGWGGVRSNQNQTIPATEIRDFAICLDDDATTGYFSIISRYSLRSETGWKELHRIKGSFYTADHSGDKNIDFPSSASYVQSSTGHVGLESARRGMDVIPTYSGSNIDSGTLIVGKHVNNQIAFVNNSWTSSWRSYGSSLNGAFWISCCAKDPSDSSVFYMGIQNERNGVGYSTCVLTKITGTTVTWSKELKTNSTHSDFNGNSGYMTMYPRDIVVHPTNGKAIFFIKPNGIPYVMCQFDTGSTAPANGTYSLGTYAGGTVTIVISDFSGGGTSSLGNANSYNNNFTVMGDSDEYEPASVSWSSGTVTDATAPTYGGEEWD